MQAPRLPLETSSEWLSHTSCHLHAAQRLLSPLHLEAEERLLEKTFTQWGRGEDRTGEQAFGVQSPASCWKRKQLPSPDVEVRPHPAWAWGSEVTFPASQAASQGSTASANKANGVAPPLSLLAPPAPLNPAAKAAMARGRRR